jgi:hypothetical protein
MNKVSVFILTCFLFSVCTVFSQENETETDQLDISGYQEELTSDVPIVKEKRLNTNLEVGTSFIYSPRNFYGPSYYVAPNLSYLVTPRLTISAGIGFEYSTLYPLYNIPNEENTMLPMTRAFLYARGSYLLTERLVVTGSVYKTINDVPKLSQYSRPMNYNYQGIDLGIQYQINRNFSIGFNMRMNNMSYPSSGLIPPDALVPIPGF